MQSMKRKLPAGTDSGKDSESPVAPEILESAKRSLASDVMVFEAGAAERARKALKCVVCNGEATQTAGEPLCWVCRRLKISAWREVDQQAPAQE
jgi:hypothetical protein